MKKLIYGLMGLFIILAFFFAWEFYQVRPVKTFEIRSITSESDAVANQDYQLHSNICRYTNKPFELIIVLTNIDTGNVINAVDTSTMDNSLKSLKLGECTVQTRLVHISNFAQVGTYTLTFNIDTKINSRNVPRVSYTTQPFNITK